MTFDMTLTEQSLSLSQQHSSPFWQRPDMTMSSQGAGSSPLGYFAPMSTHQSQLPVGEHQLLHSSAKTVSKRQQTKMLLVSLIESFCRLHGDASPEANRKLFFLICQTLRSLGFIDSEFIQDMTRVRTPFHDAFQKLFHTAVQAVRQQSQDVANEPLIGWFDPEEDADQEFDNRQPKSGSLSHSRAPSFSSEQLLLNLSVQNSRYANDFMEINMIGKGGFASAWRARNRLDGIDYAVKKIRLGRDLDPNNHRLYDKFFREIKHLARLEHRNVIRYYSSWLEYSTENTCHEEEEDDVASSSRSTDDEISVFNGRDPTFEDTVNAPSSPGFDFVAEGSTEKDGTPSASLCPPAPTPLQNDPPLQNTPPHKTPGLPGSEAVLYIQMQICPATLYDYIKFRNRRCVETGTNCVDTKRNIEIFTQLLEGTAYIHEQGIIHRDLKPSNIFLGMPTTCSSDHRSSQSYIRRNGRSRANSSVGLGYGSPSGGNHHSHSFSYDSVLTQNGLRECMWDEPWVPKIGDFGLAAGSEMEDQASFLPSPPEDPWLSHSQHGRSYCDGDLSTVNGNSTNGSLPRQRRPSLHRKRTSCVGTLTYASPEQMTRSPAVYDEKVDIYSLGIIFFELYQPFRTGMERAEALDALKQGVFPDGFVEQYPKESALILWMMNKNPAERPSAMQILEFELFSQPTDMYATLQSQLQAKSLALDNKTKEMAALQEEIERIEREKEEMVQDMQRRLNELQHKLALTQLATDKQQTSPPMSPQKDTGYQALQKVFSVENT